MNSLHKNLAEVTLCDLRLRVFHFDFFKQKNYVTRALLMFRNWSAWNSSTSPLAPWRENLISGSVRAGFGCQTAALTSTEQSFIYTRFTLKCSKFENKGLQKCTPYWRDCKKKKNNYEIQFETNCLIKRRDVHRLGWFSVQKHFLNLLHKFLLRILAMWFVYPSAVSLKRQIKPWHHELRQARTRVSNQ